MPSIRPGPALALLFASGIAAFETLGGPGSLVGAPLLRWALALLLLVLLLPVSRGAGGGFIPRRAAVGLLALALGALRGAAARREIDDAPALPEGPASVEAWVAEVPVVAPARPAGLAAAPEAARHRTTFRTCDPSLQVSVEGAVPWIQPGQKLLLEGRVGRSEGFRNPGERPHRGPPHLRVGHPACVRAIEHRPLRRPLGDAALLLRERAHRLLEALYPRPTAGFLIAMLLGDRRLLPEEHRDAMARTGTIHLLAVSGLNVGLAMALVVRLPLPSRLRLPARLLFLLGFTLVTGGAPPVARAAVMLAIHGTGEAFGRAARPLDTLGWACLVLLAFEPRWTFDLGFWLSAAAVFAMIAWAPRLTGEAAGDPAARLIPWERPESPSGRLGALLRAAARAGRRSLAVSLATSAGTAPLVLLHFSRVHPLGPLWNLVAGPLVSLILIGGGLSLSLAALHPALGAPAAFATDLAVRILFAVLPRLGEVPGSCVYLTPPPAWAVFAAQALMVLGAAPHLRRPALAALVLLASLLLGGALLAPRDPELHLFDVGGGAAALLKVPDGGSFLFDCGAGDRSRQAGERVARAVLAAGVRRLDGLVLSHPHQDHVGGVLALTAIIPPGKVWVSPLFERFPLGRAVLGALRARGIPVETAARGQSIASGSALHLDVLHPAAGETLDFTRSPNEGSLAVRARFEAAALLIPGDIEEAGTARLLSSGDELRCDLLIVPHHGRANALLPRLLRRTRPRAAIISGDGLGGGSGTLAALRRSGIEAAATWERGAVRATFRGQLRLSFPAAGD